MKMNDKQEYQNVFKNDTKYTPSTPFLPERFNRRTRRAIAKANKPGGIIYMDRGKRDG